MKKVVISAVLGLCLSIPAFARVIVFQEGKAMTLVDDSEFTISSKYTSRILYDGVLITVPPHQKVKVGKNDGKVFVSGTNLKGVEVSGKSFSSQGHAVISISLDKMKIATIKGDTSIVDNGIVINRIQKDRDGQTKNSKNSKTNNENNKQISTIAKSSMSVTEAVFFPESSQYINEVAVQQTTQDVENTDLSQSSPRS